MADNANTPQERYNSAYYTNEGYRGYTKQADHGERTTRTIGTHRSFGRLYPTVPTTGTKPSGLGDAAAHRQDLSNVSSRARRRRTSARTRHDVRSPTRPKCRVQEVAQKQKMREESRHLEYNANTGSHRFACLPKPQTSKSDVAQQTTWEETPRHEGLNVF